MEVDKSRIQSDDFLKEANRRFHDIMKKHNMKRDDSCWIWPMKTTAGYGQINIMGQLVLAHRISYMIFKGPIPKGRVLHNICGIRNCVNPDHWELAGDKNSLLPPIWKEKKHKGRRPGSYLGTAMRRLMEKEAALKDIVKEDT